jgi:hypothetical protein
VPSSDSDPDREGATAQEPWPLAVRHGERKTP